MQEMRCALLLLAVVLKLFHGLQAQCEDSEDGNIKVTGIHTANFVAGRLEICTGGEWRAVCHGGWDSKEAVVTCRQLGFRSEGALYCRNSCFGQSNEQKGIYNFHCNGRELKLEDCRGYATTSPSCYKDAGIVCTNKTTVKELAVAGCSTQLESSATTTIEMQDVTAPVAMDMKTTDFAISQDTEMEKIAPVFVTTTSLSEIGDQETLMGRSCPSLAAMAGGLGALSVILAILLVGVVTAWVYFSCRKTSSLEHTKRATSLQNNAHANHTSISYHTSSIKCSSGRSDANKASDYNLPIYEEANVPENIYHVLEGPTEYQTEEYSEVERTYEVPLSDLSGESNLAMETEYSILQH